MSKVQQRVWIKHLIILLVLFFIPLLLWLGVWQLNRAEEKKIIIERWDNAPQLMNRLPELSQAGKVKVNLTGQIIQQPVYLLDNRTRNGQVGYELVVLFQPEASTFLVLVNLGWLKAPRTRQQLPQIVLPEGPISISGRLVSSTKPMQLEEDTWQVADVVRVQSIDIKRLQQLHPALYGAVLLSEISLVSNLEVGWPVVNMSPERHLGYALQWFGLALVLITGSGLMLWGSLKRRAI